MQTVNTKIDNFLNHPPFWWQSASSWTVITSLRRNTDGAFQSISLYNREALWQIRPLYSATYSYYHFNVPRTYVSLIRQLTHVTMTSVPLTACTMHTQRAAGNGLPLRSLLLKSPLSGLNYFWRTFIQRQFHSYIDTLRILDIRNFPEIKAKLADTCSVRQHLNTSGFSSLTFTELY